MPGADHDVYQQLGELAAAMRAVSANQERHERTTESLRAEVGLINVRLGQINGERRATTWIRGAATAAIGAIAGALTGHLPIFPGAH